MGALWPTTQLDVTHSWYCRAPLVYYLLLLFDYFIYYTHTHKIRNLLHVFFTYYGFKFCVFMGFVYICCFLCTFFEGFAFGGVFVFCFWFWLVGWLVGIGLLGRWEEFGRTWGRENHNQNKLYKFVFSVKTKQKKGKSKIKRRKRMI